jgi:D-glycero-alpha-D-manno-heptose-7-phosphate kinase
VGLQVIITRTPLRVSLVGGGTDMEPFYARASGAVLSTAIQQYVYVTVKRHSELFFDEPIRLNYKVSEEVHTVDEIKNNIIRECLRFLGLDPPLYVSTVGDVPASTGLGGSSAFAVGLLNALHGLKGERVSAGQLAEEACHIEIDVLGEPIGKQDQYAAAYGGLNAFVFRPDGSVTVEHQQLADSVKEQFFGSMLMLWTGITREASGILVEQQKNVDAEWAKLCAMRDQVQELQALLQRDQFDVKEFGSILDAGWRLKHDLASGISNPMIDEYYERALAAGALGGKLCGAGGGGFLLLVVEPQHHAAVRRACGELSELPIVHEVHGSHLVLPFRE